MRTAPTLDHPDPPLVGELVRLRPYRMDDLPCVREASADPDIPEGTTVPATWSEDAGRAWIERQWGRREQGQGLAMAIALADTDRAVGHINAFHRSVPGTVSIGYWLLAPYRGRGLGRETVSLWVAWLRQVPHVARIEALVEPHNVPSQRTLEGAGLEREGLLRSVLAFETRRADAYSYSLIP